MKDCRDSLPFVEIGNNPYIGTRYYFVVCDKVQQCYYVMYRTQSGFNMQASKNYQYKSYALKFYERVKNNANYVSNI